jgi:hypothetical protein
MSAKTHRQGVSEANRVVRNLKLEKSPEPNLAAAAAEIDKLYGMDEVTLAQEGTSIRLAYDASIVSIDDIEAILKKYSVEVGHGWWNHFKEDHYRFVDQNVKDNAEHVPTCCSKMPPGFGKK